MFFTALDAQLHDLGEVPILPISCSGASPISPGRVPAILNSWSTDEFQPLLAAGIDERGIEVGRAVSG